MIDYLKKWWISFYYYNDEISMNSLLFGIFLAFMFCIFGMLAAMEIYYIVTQLLYVGTIIENIAIGFAYLLFAFAFFGMFANILMFVYLRNTNGLNLLDIGD